MLLAIRPGSPANKDFGYAVSDYEPGMGLTCDSHSLRCASPLLLLLSAPEGSCLSSARACPKEKEFGNGSLRQLRRQR